MFDLNFRWIVVSLVCLVGACVVIPKSHLLVPSRTTANKLHALSLQSGAIADVLTVNREEHVLMLDGSGAGALSGQAIDTGSKDVLADRFTIPFENLALVYYAGPAKKTIPIALRLPLKEAYPKLPAAGVEEQGMACAELDVNLQRADAVRWFARREGALPFTPHQQLMEHAKNTAIVVGETILVAAMIAGGGGGIGSGAAQSPDQATLGLTAQVGEKTLRWAITFADQRLLGLLQIKRDRQCAALAAPNGGGETDLAILAKIDATRLAPDAHQMSDQEQLDQQTQILDLLDPPSARAQVQTRVCTGASDPVNVQTVTCHDGVVWIADVDATNMHSGDYGKVSPVKGTLVLGERELRFNPKNHESSSSANLTINYADIALVEVKHHWGIYVVVISHVDGHVDSLQVVPGLFVDTDQTIALGKLLQTKLPTPSPTAPANQ